MLQIMRRGIRSTSVTNTAFLLPIVAIPMSDTPIETILRMLEQGYPVHVRLSRSLSCIRNAPWHVGYVLYEL
jgi:hypothetical protein